MKISPYIIYLEMQLNALLLRQNFDSQKVSVTTSIMVDDVLPENFVDGCGRYIGHGLHFNPFSKVLHRYNGEGVIALCRFEFLMISMPQHCKSQDVAISCEGCDRSLE
jgi:hypothetical protein